MVQGFGFRLGLVIRFGDFGSQVEGFGRRVQASGSRVCLLLLLPERLLDPLQLRLELGYMLCSSVALPRLGDSRLH